MSDQLASIAGAGRHAVAVQNWDSVNLCGLEICRQAPTDPEGPFLLGLAHKAAGRLPQATDNFGLAISLDSSRYDAAIELAFQCVLLSRFAEAKDLLDKYQSKLGNSPVYLNLAGEAYTRLNLHEEAWPMFESASKLQPEIEKFDINRAACAVYLGKIDVAKSIYRKLLSRHPAHRRYHYDLAKLARARNDRHVKKMLKVLRKTKDEPANNIYLFYALGKELEDLARWEEAFSYYKRAGDAVKSVSNYDVSSDIAIIDKIIAVCTAEWLANEAATRASTPSPVFIVGLPRTGTTLAERVISSHSHVDSVGETQLLQMILRRHSNAAFGSEMTPDIIQNAVDMPASTIASNYLDAISYCLGGSASFIDKLPENVLYLGFIAKSWPNAKIIHMRRHPMDACFANYKQSYFRYAYSLEDVANYYLAYDRLSRHWRDTLGERMIEVQYESLAADPEKETRRMLDFLDLPFEEACLNFERNATAIATASAVQVREKIHTRSVGRWKRFDRQLRPLRERLERGGVAIQ